VKTYPAVQRDGHVTAFEIEHACMSCMTVSRILKQVAGVSDVHVAGCFGSSSDIRVEFAKGSWGISIAVGNMVSTCSQPGGVNAFVNGGSNGASFYSGVGGGSEADGSYHAS
jgi:hypothetical protein